MAAIARIDPATIFTPSEWAGLSQRSNWRGAGLVLHAYALIAGATALYVAFPNPATFVLGVMIVGARQLGLAILMHEAAHNALFGNRGLNDWVGEWLCAAPVGASLAAYRPYHLAHHRYTEQAEDPDLALSAPFPVSRLSFLRKALRDLSGLTFLKQRVGVFFVDPKSLPPGALTLSQGRWRFLATNAVLLAGFSALGIWELYFLLWLAPMATWMMFVTRLRNIAEHACVSGGKDDPFRQARTTAANILERLLIAPYSVHFHAEHHLFMHLPCWRLERAHRLLLAKNYGRRMVLASGYGEVVTIAASK